MACNRPDCYYNIPDYPHANIYGVVLDQNANPIKDAYVVAWSTVAGCDSVLTLHLTINDTNQTDLYVSACENFTWNGETYTVSGDYIYSHQGTNGCLQADTLHLTINHSVATEEYLTICESDLPYTYHDTVFLPGTPESLSVSTSLLTESGCDSTVTMHLTVIDTALRIELLTADFCENMSAELVAVTQMTDYLWNTGEEMPNITVTRPGLYSVTVL